MIIETEYYVLKTYSNLLYVRSFLSWDERVTKAFGNDVKKTVLKHYQGKAWAILHDSREWKLGTPEMEPIIARMMTTGITGTLTHHALVIGHSELRKWQSEKMFKDIKDYEAQTFESMQDAEEWLVSFGYHEAKGLSEER